MKTSLALLAAVVVSTSATLAVNHDKAPATLDYETLNRQACEEYSVPLRPGYEEVNPYWNEFSTKFIYAPAFDFAPVEGAVSYRYAIGPDTVPGKSIDFAPLTFTAGSPGLSLSPVWSHVPVTKVLLTVEGLDGKGRVVGVAGQRVFRRDFAYSGPYNGPARSYREAALKGMLFIHNLPQVKAWLTKSEPDMTYTYYAYANKIVSAIIRNECLVAANVPSQRDDALAIARAAARFLMDNSQPATAPLAYFPPTYYKGQMAGVADAGETATMTMDANYTVQALLDLYDATVDSVYYRRALDITRTYVRLQRSDGSWPIKVSYDTGEPVSETGAMLHSICMVADRMARQYGVTEFVPMLDKAERWMHDVALRTFDLNAQFEDVSVLGLKPYENLTNYVAANYARYLLDKAEPTAADIADARQLIQLSEDQFVHWDCLPDSDGLRHYNTPCVVEQYKFRVPVDNSAANVSGALLRYYKVTGDTLAYAKAKALVDNMTIQQHAQSGYLPTYWDYRNARADELSMWTNCAYTVIERLLEFAAMQP